jgi:phosphatidylglycerophosphate synthase
VSLIKKSDYIMIIITVITVANAVINYETRSGFSYFLAIGAVIMVACAGIHFFIKIKKNIKKRKDTETPK